MVIKTESPSTLNDGVTNGKVVLTMQESGGYTGEEIYTEVLFGKNINLCGS